MIKSFVDDQDDHYLLQLEMRIQADPQQVYRLLTDFDHLGQLTDTIIASKVLQKNGPHSRVRLETQGCVWFFCRKVTQVQEVKELGQGYIMIAEVQQQSDFSYGYTLWHIRQEGSATRVSLSADLVPDFWIPPLIGAWLFKDKLLQEGQTLINSLEAQTQP